MAMNAHSIYRDERSKEYCLEQYRRMLAEWPKPFSESWIETGYGRTHVLVNGAAGAPAIVLLHGQWASAMSWKAVVASFSARYRTYAVDQVNDVGLSEPDSPIAGRKDYVDWLRQMWTGLGLGKAAVMGQSYGGYLATLFALSNPGKVEKLVLLCPGLPVLGRPGRKWLTHGLPMMIVPTRATARWLVKMMSVNGYDPSDGKMELIARSVTGLRSRASIRPEIEPAELQSLQMPVLLLLGEKEAMYDPGEAAGNAERLFPNAVVSVIKGAGHLLIKDQEEAVLQRITEFLS